MSDRELVHEVFRRLKRDAQSCAQSGEVRLDRRQDLLKRTRRLGNPFRGTAQDCDRQTQVGALGHPQERTLGIPFFLDRYGPALVDRLLDELPLQLGYHHVLTI